MIREKSCGAVIFLRDHGATYYLLERMVKGHTSLCKGHVEGEETEHETAAREIFEETGLTVRFMDGFRRTIEYSPYEGCMKEVVFFLAESEGWDVVCQPEEVKSVQWAPLGDALTALTHSSDREVLLAADRFLSWNSVTPFRPMRRKNRQMSEERCVEILKNATSGVLALSGDDGYPYAVPLSYVYDGGAIFFHGAKKGHKLDSLRRDDRCSFCVVDRDDVAPEEYTTRYRSVIAFGRIHEIRDEREMREAVTVLAKKYNPTDALEHREKYINDDFPAMSMLRLDIEHMTGKEN